MDDKTDMVGQVINSQDYIRRQANKVPKDGKTEVILDPGQVEMAARGVAAAARDFLFNWGSGDDFEFRNLEHRIQTLEDVLGVSFDELL